MKKRKNISRSSVKWFLSMLLAIALITVNCRSVSAASADEGETQAATTTSGNAVDNACKGVVRILSVFSDGSFSTGSGFAVGEQYGDATIFVTNCHVVKDLDSGVSAKSVYILLDNYAFAYNSVTGQLDIDDSRMVKCKVLKTTNGYPDYAIIEAKDAIEGIINLPLIESEKAQRGQTVYALGFPANSDIANGGSYLASQTEDVTVTTGTISRFTEMNIAGDTDVIQHDAHISGGNSGGPLITEDGTVIGINTYGFGEDGSEYSASIYIDYAINALDDLRLPYQLAGTVSVATVTEGAEDSQEVKVVTPEASTQEEEEDQSTFPVKIIVIAAGIALVILILLLIILVATKHKKTPPKKEPPKTDPSIYTPPIPTPPTPTPPIPNPDPHTIPLSSNSYRLQGVTGYFAGKRFSINGQVRIGRDPAKNDLVYPANTKGVSHVHCELIQEMGALYIRDLGSSYGTFLNGVKLTSGQKYPLNLGDHIDLAHSDERFQITKKSY